MYRKISIIIGILLIALLLMPAIKAYAVSWSNNLNAALTEAKNKQKPLMVDFYTDWCDWCKKLDQDTYTDKKVNELAQNFICVKVDADRDRAATSKYGVSGFPTIVFLNYEGAVDEKVVGYRPAAQFLQVMEMVLNKTKKPTAK